MTRILSLLALALIMLVSSSTGDELATCSFMEEAHCCGFETKQSYDNKCEGQYKLGDISWDVYSASASSAKACAELAAMDPTHCPDGAQTVVIDMEGGCYCSVDGDCPNPQTYRGGDPYSYHAYNCAGFEDNANPGYLGCYTDNGSRDFCCGPKTYGYTQETCNTACASYTYFALQHDGWCTCDNSYGTPSGTYYKVDDSECGTNLRGGSYTNAVYETKPSFNLLAHSEGCDATNKVCGSCGCGWIEVNGVQVVSIAHPQFRGWASAAVDSSGNVLDTITVNYALAQEQLVPWVMSLADGIYVVIAMNDDVNQLGDAFSDAFTAMLNSIGLPSMVEVGWSETEIREQYSAVGLSGCGYPCSNPHVGYDSSPRYGEFALFEVDVGAYVDSVPTALPSVTPTATPVYCSTFTCPESMKHKPGYELIEGESQDICCDMKMCSDYSCSAEDGDKIAAHTTTEGYTFDTCCVCNFGTSVFYGAVAIGDYIVNGETGDGTPTMSITLPIPSDITVTELTWYQGDGSGDYSPTNVNSWEVTDVNSCKKHYKYFKTIPTFFGSASKWSIEGTAIFSSITMAGTKTVTETFGTFTETYQRTVRHAIGIKVGLATTSTVTATFQMDYDSGILGYSIVTGIVDNFAADGSEVTLTMIVKSPDCMSETATLTKGGDYIVATETSIAIGASSLDANDLCQQEVTFKFMPKTCFDQEQDFQLSFTSRTGNPLTIDMAVNIECASFLDDLPILATLTFHASQDTLDTEQTTFQLGEEVYALLDTSTLVPLTNIEIESVVIVQTGYSGTDESTQLKPVQDEIYMYTDQYPAPNMGADTAMMMWDLESSHFTVSASGATAKTTVDFRVTYDSGYTFRRSLEVDTKFNDPVLDETEFGYSDDMVGEFKIVDESLVGAQDLSEKPKSLMKYMVLGALAAAVLAGYRHYQSQAEEKSSLLNVYQMEEDVF